MSVEISVVFGISERRQKWVSTEVKSFADHTENATPLEKIDKTDKIENNKNCNLEKARMVRKLG